jgi:type IV pilus assembly protein PilA
MLYRLRQSSTDEGGFTLIELLVVILIIGILAAIAIPAFLSQTSKASDSAAKTQVGTLETTMETYANEHNGAFTGATIAELQAIEPTLKDTTTATGSVTVGGAQEFTAKSVAKGTGDTYELIYKNGEVERKCTNANGSTVCKNGTW